MFFYFLFLYIHIYIYIFFNNFYIIFIYTYIYFFWIIYIYIYLYKIIFYFLIFFLHISVSLSPFLSLAHFKSNSQQSRAYFCLIKPSPLIGPSFDLIHSHMTSLIIIHLCTHSCLMNNITIDCLIKTHAILCYANLSL